MATISLIAAENIAYFLGGAEAPLAKLWWYAPLSSSIIVVGITLISLLGLRIGKWLQDIGGVAHLLTFGALIAVPYFAIHRGMLSAYHPLAATLPTFTPLSLNNFRQDGAWSTIRIRIRGHSRGRMPQSLPAASDARS